MDTNQSKENINFIDLIESLRKYIFVFVAAVLIAGIAGFMVSKFFITPQYESEVMLIVNTKQDNTMTITNDNITSAQHLVDTYAVIIKSNVVLNQVIKNLNLDMTYRDLHDKINVSAVDDTQIMRIAVRDYDPKQAKEITKEISNIAPHFLVGAINSFKSRVRASERDTCAN